MTISSTTYRNQYTGNGSNTVYAYTFKIFNQSNISVFVNGVLQTIGTHYSVSGVGSDSGGNITFVTAPANAAVVTIRRNEPLTQEIDYVENDTFPASAHEEGLDRSTIRDQFLQEQIDRCARLADGSTLSSLTIPTPSANKALVWNATATGLENSANDFDDVLTDLNTAVTTASTAASTATTQAATATTQAGLATTAATQANAVITRWNYSNDVNMADPSAGNFRFNNSTPNLSTAMAISATTANTGAPNFRLEMLTWDDSTNAIRGTLTFKSVTSPQNFLTFSITGALTDNTTWLQFTIANVASGGTITNGEPVSIEFARAGNAGTSFTATDITGQTQTAIALGDSIVYSDVSNGGALRRDTIQGIANLIPGGVALVSSGTMSAVSAVNFTSIGSYNFYRLMLSNLTLASGSGAVNFRFSADNGATYVATDYTGQLLQTTGSSVVGLSVGSNTDIVVAEINDVAARAFSAAVDIMGMNSSGYPGVFSNTSARANTATNGEIRIYSGNRQTAITANAFRIVPASSTMSGAYRLYGWN